MSKSKNILLVFLAVVLVLLGFSGCANDNPLSKIKVEGEYGKQPKVEVPKPFSVAETTTLVLHQGDGAAIPENGQVLVNYYGVNGRTGEVFDESFSRGGAVFFALDQVVPGFKKGLTGQKVGSRVVIGIPSKDGYGDNPPQESKISSGDTLIFVVDVVKVPLTKPEGEKQEIPADMPQVKEENGKFTVTMPKAEPPKEDKVAKVILGKGDKVTDKSTVGVHYQIYSWKTGKMLGESQGVEDISMAQVSDIWKETLKDMPLGSQVMVVSQNAAKQAAEEQAKEQAKSATASPAPAPTITADDAIVYLVDIRYIR